MGTMSYASAVDQLYGLGLELAPTDAATPRRKFDLAHMRSLMAALGNPQGRFASVLIAGTNGKGSTAATLASILAAAGHRTGLYTSPHLLRVNERIQMSVPTMPSEYASADEPMSAGPAGLAPITDGEFAEQFFRVDAAARLLVENGGLPHAPSFFEVLTAVAFLAFAERRVELAVLEVGLGGRLDATNIVEPLLSVITDIGLDHQDYLGTTIAEIAREKAGILRATGTLVTLPQHPEANRVFGEVAAEMPGMRAVSAAGYVPGGNDPRTGALGRGDGPGGVAAELSVQPYVVSVEDEPVTIASPLGGRHQQRNLALAIASVVEIRNQHGYKIPNAAIEAGIRETRWPGRLQVMALAEGVTLLLDVAHNPAGAWSLRSVLSQISSAVPRTLLFSCLRDKDLREMTQILFPLFDSSSTEPERRGDHVVLAPIDNPRAAAVTDLLEAAHRLGVPAHAAPHLAAALAQAREVTPTGGLIVVTGSVYLVGEVLGLVQGPA